ncbi:PEP-CTERM sorting domain-containing protein [Haloferula sp.]|uniref:PEP-CTERM sorting domain-containing protein n=1 Tax=Haloferula sp. TaxID=2497595 RepID=UPI003C723C46
MNPKNLSLTKSTFSTFCAAAVAASTLGADAATIITVNNSSRPGISSGAGSTIEIAGATGIATKTGLASGSVVYTVTGVDLTSEGGTATESFSFTVTYTAANGTPAANGFGNMAVNASTGTGTDNNQIDGDETLTGIVSLTSSTFAGLGLNGFTEYKGGGFQNGETATITHAGGSLFLAKPGNSDSSSPFGSISGTSFTHTPTSGGHNTEGFKIQFTAVPEPTSVALFGLGGLALIVRRRR